MHKESRETFNVKKIRLVKSISAALHPMMSDTNLKERHRQ